MKGRAEVSFEIEGLGTERLLNEARARGIVFFRVQRGPDRRVRVFCSPGMYAAVQSIGEEKGYMLSPARPEGWYRVWRRLLRRWGLWAGAAITLILMICAMGLIWEIRIENAGPYQGEVRTFLEEKGVQIGKRRQQVDAAFLQQQLEWRLPAVKWVQVDYRGAALIVRLEEGTPPPEILSHRGDGDVVAAEDGVLLRLTVHAGTPAAEPGQMVKKGQVLIRGAERGKDGNWIAVQARGQAMARLWVSAEIRMPLEETLSVPTGREAERTVIDFPFGRLPLSDTPSFLSWDMERKALTIGCIWLPVLVYREQYREVALEKSPRSLDEVKGEAAKGALLLLEKGLADENIVDKWLEFRMIEGDTIAAVATAEIHRDIASCEKN